MIDDLVSIIVPIYNCEKYLKECINSLVDQTYKNIEILLIDDGSTDSSATICDEYVDKDKRVKYFHKENGGVASARNLGLDKCIGSYIVFLDSDDILNTDFINKLYKIAREKNADVVQSNYVRFKTNNELEKYTNNASFSNEVIQIDPNMVHKSLYGSYRYPYIYVWGKLYKSDLLKDIRFIDGLNFEDSYFTYRVLSKANSFYKTDDILIFYRVYQESTCNNTNNPKYFDIYKILDIIKEDYSKNNQNELLSLCLRYYLKRIVSDYFLLKDKDKNDSRLKELKDNYTKIKKEYDEVTSSNINKIAFKWPIHYSSYKFIRPMYLVFKKRVLKRGE